MKIQYYCYTRTSSLDYGDFVLPSLSNIQIEFIRNKVLSITGDTNAKFSIPKWILIKTNDFIVWGCCCWNSLLAQRNFTDSFGRSVYGFFSVVITGCDINDIKLPIDVEFFQTLYLNEVEKFWYSSENHKSSTTSCYLDGFSYVSPKFNDCVCLLNTNMLQCQSLGELDKECVIAAALTIDNVSLLIDNDNIEQATNKKGAFMNCLTPSVEFGLHIVKLQCPKCKKYVASFTATGVCLECKDSEEQNKKEEEEISKQVKIELEDFKTKITELESEIEISNIKLKKKERLVKILTIVSVVLFTGLLYIYSTKLILSKEMENNGCCHSTREGGFNNEYGDSVFTKQSESIVNCTNN